jgi:hypothetical protein
VELITVANQFHQDQQNEQSPVNSNGNQFHQDQQANNQL